MIVKVFVLFTVVLATRSHFLQKLYFQFIFATLCLLPFFVAVVCEQTVLNNHDFPTVAVEPSGFSQTDLNEAVAHALNLCQVRDLLNDTRNRVLSSEFLSAPESYGPTKETVDAFQARVYDYTHGRTVLINGIPFDPIVMTTVANIQPLPDQEELAEAGRIAEAQPSEIVTGSMPPFITRDFPDGSSQRILNIAITSANSSRSVLVNMNNRTVESSPSSVAQPLTCSAPGPKSGSAPGNVGATANLVISQAGKQLWTFEAITPSASSGHRGSAVELRNVKYKGKTVLFQAHVPILNVEYEHPTPNCGPLYRDWQSAQWPLQCSGTDLAPGFRLCSSPAKSILDSNTDGGNFGGVAVYVEGLEVVLKAQMWAGWYRYVSEWRFHVDGTLRPRFGFGAVLQGDACVCLVHHHNVYWRLDFDIVTAGNNLVREFNNPPLIGSSNYHDKVYEIRRPKDASRHRHWEISNTRTHDTYSLIPGSNDGTLDAFSVGDLWVLRWHPDELDDGETQLTGPPELIRANIDNLVDGELVKDKDVVVWYGAHFKHDQSHEGVVNHIDHIVGPDIRPVKW